MFVPPLLEVQEEPCGRRLIARKKITKHKTIFRFHGTLLHKSAVTSFRYPLQVDEEQFLDSLHEFENYLNHSCEPNCYIDFSTYELRALRSIQPGEELTYHYCTSEYDLVEQKGDFRCQCRTHSCMRRVRGYKYLTLQQKSSLAHLLSPYLLRKLRAEEKEMQIPKEIYTSFVLTPVAETVKS